MIPRSLFSRLVIVFLLGLIVAQVASLAIVLQDRGEFLSRASGVQSVRRIADTVILFDTVSISERERLVKLLSSPSMRISIMSERPRLPVARVLRETNESPQSVMFTSILQRMLGRERHQTCRLGALSANNDHPSLSWPFEYIRGRSNQTR